MTDSVMSNLLDREGRILSLCDLPAEMLQTILSYCSLLILMRLSTTCSVLRYNVHEVFTSRIFAQAAKYPEVKQSLDRLGWRKKHNFWDCTCFKMMGGPVFSWSQLEEQRNFSVVCQSNFFNETSTTTAGKSFFMTDMTSDTEIRYGQVGPGSTGGRSSVRTLVTFENIVYQVTLASYDNVFVVLFKTWDLDPRQHTVLAYVFYASTLVKVAELNLGNDEDGPVAIKAITLTQDTMVLGFNYYNEMEEETNSKIHIWKMDTKDPREEGISLLRTMSHHNSELSREILNLRLYNENPFCVNSQFIVIFDKQNYNDNGLVKVFQRSQKNSLIRQIDIGDKILVGMGMQEGDGDHIAFLLRHHTHDGVAKFTVKVYSASRGELIIQKEAFDSYLWSYSPLIIKWFGDHLIIGTRENSELLLVTWQPGQPTFLNSPFRVPVVRRSARRNTEENIKWITSCLKLDFQGLTTATYKLDGYIE